MRDYIRQESFRLLVIAVYIAMCPVCGWQECYETWSEADVAIREHNTAEHGGLGGGGVAEVPGHCPGWVEPEEVEPEEVEPEDELPVVERDTLLLLDIGEAEQCARVKGLVPAKVDGVAFYQFARMGDVRYPLVEISWEKFEEALSSRSLGVFGRNCFMKIRKV